MRALYVVIGLLLGVWYTSNIAILQLDSQEEYWLDEIGTYTLVGYHEGWQRGREQTHNKDLYFFLTCMEQLDYAQSYAIELKKGCPKNDDFKWGKCE